MKAKVPARELKGLDVKFVSLVDHAANRIPFRIIKSNSQSNPEKTMIDLSKLGLKKSEKPTPQSPTLAGVILSKSDEALLTKARELLKAEGFDLPTTKVFEDGTAALSVDDKFQEGSTLIRLNDDMAVVMKGFDPWCTPLNDLSFGEAAASRGYYDGVRGATSVLTDLVWDKLYKADSPADAASEVQKVLNDFGQYVLTLTKGLPAKVFKAEIAVVEMLKAAPAPVAKAEDNKPVDEPAATPAAAPAAAPAEPVAAAPAAQEPAASENQPDAVQKAINLMTEMLATVKKSVETVTATVEEVKKSQQATEQKVAEVAQKAEDATRVVKAVVPASESSGDPAPKAAVVKSEDDDPRSGAFDSAFIRKSNKR